MPMSSMPSATVLVGLSRLQRIVAANVLALSLGLVILILAGSSLGFVPAIATLLLTVRGDVLRAVQRCIGGAFVCALAALIVAERSAVTVDVVLFLGASLCVALTLVLIEVPGAFARSEAGEIADRNGALIDTDLHRRTVEALRDREQELLEIVNFVPSNLWRLRPDGEPTFFNQPMVEFLGIDVGELERENGSRLEAMIHLAVHPDDQERFSAELARSLSTGEGFSSQYRLRRHDGVYRWMSSRGAALHDRNGRVVQWNGLCLDIDDQGGRRRR
jgi:PAS domain S-box-containing protein